ncbi:MAG: BMP family ABC transporter substrate-binding protein, partial [Oscillospiraceae bacterium]|nr:BMP family ABC transporter substrate-binding protein [Oscillospiraceae bacterium]
MKKYLALALALVMVLALCACGGNSAPSTPSTPSEPSTPSTPAEPTVITNADEIDDNMTSADGKYEVAFITDVGQLKDKSFNQGTYDGVKLFAANNGLSYKYYQPANGDAATDDDRYDAMKAAVEGGAKVI